MGLKVVSWALIEHWIIPSALMSHSFTFFINSMWSIFYSDICLEYNTYVSAHKWCVSSLSTVTLIKWILWKIWGHFFLLNLIGKIFSLFFFTFPDFRHVEWQNWPRFIPFFGWICWFVAQFEGRPWLEETSEIEIKMAIFKTTFFGK